MFERYTENARRAIFFARFEASVFGSLQIESEHLLLGILHQNKTVANRFLNPPDSWESIRKEVEEHTINRETVSTSEDLPLSGECRRILAYAAEEADIVSHKHVGTEHLLLGILRAHSSFAAKLLNDRGASLESARAQLNQPNVGWQRDALLRMPPRSTGVPAGFLPHRLLYNAASESLILELHGAGAKYLFPSRIFVRHKGLDGYEQIGNPPQGVCYESAVTCETRTIVAFNSIRWKESEPGHWGQEWEGVYSFDPNSKEPVLRLSDRNLRLDEPHLRTWITELVSISEDAEKLYVKVVVEKAVPSGRVEDYFFASVRLSEGKLTLLAPLKDIRF